jgi:hypothetical protein
MLSPAKLITHPRGLGFRVRGQFFLETWFSRYRRTEMELGRRVSFPRGFKGGRASEPRHECADLVGLIALIAAL